jgi:CheY-like chemotaxis protein
MATGGTEVTQVRAGRTADVLTGLDRILLADADPTLRAWLRDIVAGHYDLDAVETGDAALDRLAAGTARLVVIGRSLRDMTGEQLMDRAAQWLVPDRRVPATFLLTDAAGTSLEIDDARFPIFYRLVPTMPPERVRELLAQAAGQLPPRPPRDLDPTVAARVAESAQRIGAHEDPTAAAEEAINAVCVLLGASRARCLYCDEDTGLVWSGNDDSNASSYASAGLVGFAIRSAGGIAVPHGAMDPSFDRTIDDPSGTGDERIAAHAVIAPDGHAHAVLLAIRTAQQPAFSDAELELLGALATAWGPYILQLAMRVEADEILGDRLDRGPSDMFRQEAVMHLVRRGHRGDVVRVHPNWVRSAYWLVLAALVAAVGFAALAHVHQYAEGPAIVIATGRTELIAPDGGTISALAVVRGQHVAAGQIVARLHDTNDAGRLKSLDADFERRLIAYLLSPADPAVRQALSVTVTERDSARSSVESHQIRASHAGIVDEVMVRNGQHVDPGKVVITTVERADSAGFKVIAFLPGSERPRLHSHQSIRLVLPGYRNAVITAEVRAISNEVLGANEARARWLDDRVGDSLPMTGPVVAVEARLASSMFDADRQQFALHDGMTGMAEIELTSQSLLESLLPGAR